MNSCFSRAWLTPLTHCLDDRFVSGLWKDMVDSTKKSPLQFTPSCFWAEEKSLGTQRADFFTRPKSSLRMAWMVLIGSPWQQALGL
jgi:hypothetical protein